MKWRLTDIAYLLALTTVLALVRWRLGFEVAVLGCIAVTQTIVLAKKNR